MGTLDDAIREHLELKRLNGADPGEVAKQERDALGPVRREVGPSSSEGSVPKAIEAETASETDAARSDGQASLAESVDRGTGQETVEIDMQRELAGGPAATPDADRAAPAGPARAQVNSGDSLEWEMPGDRADGDESAPDEPNGVVEDQVDDVLEETPDFLRETPEHERLWFEQRPPRDFDFNE